MSKDNKSPVNAAEYDKKISVLLPYYSDFHAQTLSLVQNMGYEKVRWLDLGCGTGTLAQKACSLINEISFVMLDPSAQMLEVAKTNNPGLEAEYLCAPSEAIDFTEEFQVVTAIQSHHYMTEEARKHTTQKVFNALKPGGMYITFENVVPEMPELRQLELQRWGSYQRGNGRTEEQIKAHQSRCGVEYLPITVPKHIRLMKEAGFRAVHVFWISYMQAGIYGIK